MSYSNWVSSEFIIMDYVRKGAHSDNLDEESVYLACEEAVDQLITANNYTEYVMLLNLHNQKAALPINFKYPTQVGYRPPFVDECTPPEQLRRYFIKSFSDQAFEDIKVDACNTCKQKSCSCETKQWYPIETTDTHVTLVKEPVIGSGYSKFMYGVDTSPFSAKGSYISEISHNITDITLGANKAIKNKLVKCYSKINKCPEFQIVRPASNYFFNLPNELKACNIPSYDTNLEYKIDNKIITLNNYDYKCNQCKGCHNNEGCYINYPMETSGEVLISYLGKKIDDKGFLMIPDEPYIIKAITDYIITYMAQIDYAIRKDQITERYWKNMMQISDRSMIQAKSRFRTPTYDRFNWFLKRLWTRRFPEHLNNELLNRYTSESKRKVLHQNYNNAYHSGNPGGSMFDNNYLNDTDVNQLYNSFANNPNTFHRR